MEKDGIIPGILSIIENNSLPVIRIQLKIN